MVRKLLVGREDEYSFTLTMYCHYHKCELELDLDSIANGPDNGFQAEQMEDDTLWAVFVGDTSGAFCPKSPVPDDRALTKEEENELEKCFESWTVAVVVGDGIHLVEVPDREQRV